MNFIQRLFNLNNDEWNDALSMLQIAPFRHLNRDLWPFALPVLISSLLLILMHLLLTHQFGFHNVIPILQHNSPTSEMPFVYQLVLYLYIPPCMQRGPDGKRALQLCLLSHRHKEIVELRLTERMLFSRRLPAFVLLLLRSLWFLRFFDLFGVFRLIGHRQVQFQLRREQPMPHLLGVRVQLTRNVNGYDPLRYVYLHGITTFCLRSGLAYYSSFEQILHPVEMLNQSAKRFDTMQHGPLKFILTAVSRWRIVRAVRAGFQPNEPLQLDLAGGGNPNAPGLDTRTEDQAYASEVRANVLPAKKTLVQQQADHWKMRRGPNGNLDPARSIIYAEEPPFACSWQGTGIPFDFTAHPHAGLQMNFVYEHLMRYYIRDPSLALVDNKLNTEKANVKANSKHLFTPKESVSPILKGMKLTQNQWELVNQEMMELSFDAPQVGLIQNIDSSAKRSEQLNKYILHLRHGILFTAHLSPLESLLSRLLMMLISQLVHSMMIIRGISSSGGWNIISILILNAMTSLIAVISMEQMITCYVLYFKTPFDSLDSTCKRYMKNFGSRPIAWIGRHLPFYSVSFALLRLLIALVVLGLCILIHLIIPIILNDTLETQLDRFNVHGKSIELLFQPKTSFRMTFRQILLVEKDTEAMPYKNLVIILVLTVINIFFALRFWPVIFHAIRVHFHENLSNWQMELRNLATYDVYVKQVDKSESLDSNIVFVKASGIKIDSLSPTKGVKKLKAPLKV